MLPVRPKETLSLVTCDRTRLDADVYYPQGPGPFPVLLMRQPYGRAIASTVVYAHPTWYAAHGYIVVIQDVRGRGTSEGEFKLFAHEVRDGLETVEWAAHLPGSNGKVGMYGFSYQGMTQLYAAQANPPSLTAIAPAMVGYDLYHDWAYENGALRLQASLGWALQLAAETARLKGDETAFQQLFAASRSLPVTGSIPAYPDVLKDYATDSFFHDWLAHPTNDDYWQTLKPELTDVDLPMLHVGGWFDPYLTGDLRLYQEFAARSQHPQQLWVGPWSHIPWSRKVGAVDFGPEAINPIDRLQIRWFDHCLKDADPSLLSEPSLHLFEMGTNHWRTFDHWPTTRKNIYYLTSTGLAAIREDDGILVSQSEWDSPPKSSAGAEHRKHHQNPQLVLGTANAAKISDILVHDPWRPVPSLGGHASFPAGSFERSALDGRSDVLTYTTGLLETDCAVLGEVTLVLSCQSDAVSYDLCAVLSVVYPDGAVYNLTQGYCRIDNTARPDVITLPLQPTCFCLQAGQALRLSLSAACFPAYAVNPGTGDTAQTARLITAQTITIQVNGDGESALHISLLTSIPKSLKSLLKP